MNADTILLLSGSAVVAAVVGLGVAKFHVWFGNRMEVKRAKAFLNGQARNEIVMDEEKINVDKFQYKTPDKKMVKWKTGNIHEIEKIVDSEAS